jgi:Domain of unknown function (DUF4386)
VSKDLNARLAGLIYLVVVITGLFSLAYVPSQLIVWDNAATTVNNILASEFLFRLDIVSGLLCYTCFFILPFVLYKLFSPVNKTCAVLMVALAAVSVPISFFNLINKLDIISLLSESLFSNAFEPQQLHAQVMLLLESYNNGISAVQIFWGLWLFPFGYLVFKSSYLPKILGVLLMIGCVGYLVQFFVVILAPNFDMPGFVGLPGSIGEIGTCLWLLIMGVKDPGNAKVGVDEC